MSHTDPTYVIFDGDEDKWAYSYMRGWKANKKIDFDFEDAHELFKITNRAQDPEYIKSILRKRMKPTTQAIVLIGEKTKSLYRYVRWELELVIEKKIPLIAVNLNGSRTQDDRCPPIIRDKCVLHIPFRARVIKYALDNYVAEYGFYNDEEKSKNFRYYENDVYRSLGIKDHEK